MQKEFDVLLRYHQSAHMLLDHYLLVTPFELLDQGTTKYRYYKFSRIKIVLRLYCG